MKKRVKEPLIVHSIPCDSEGEREFVEWMQELKEGGYIIDYDRGESYILSTGLDNYYSIESKKGIKLPKVKAILHPHIYSLDFEIQWSMKGVMIFCNVLGEKWDKYFLCDETGRSFIECKPTFDYANMTRLVTLNIKWLYQSQDIYCQIVKTPELFKETFLPKVLWKTPKTGKNRVFKYKPKTLDEFINLNK